MNFRQMQYFTAVYEEGTFSRAAERENGTQSGLSQQIRNLEERLKLRLFERTPHGVVPTSAGKEYYAHCVPILQSVHAAEQQMAELQGSLSGTINAGLIPSLTKGALATVLTAFTTEHPFVDFRIVEAVSQPLTEQVVGGELDFAIVPVMPETSVPGLSRRVLAREQELLLSGPGLGMTNMAPVSLHKLSAMKLVLPSPANSRRPFLERQMASAGVTPARIMDIDGMTGIFEFVAESDWATILPVTNCIAEVAGPRLTVNPIVRPEITFEFILIEPSRRPLSAAARTFIAAIEARLGEIGEEWQQILKDHRRTAE
jgi:LysR family nitrogen assimilation transcriptional regulator